MKFLRPFFESVIPSNHFTWNKETNTFSQEASTLGLRGWPQSIQIRSVKTGKVLTFSHPKPDRDQEELYGMNYTNPETGIKLLIIND